MYPITKAEKKFSSDIESWLGITPLTYFGDIFEDDCINEDELEYDV